VLSVAVLALSACASAPHVPPSAATIAALTHERQIIAVHYHALGTPGPLHNGVRLVDGSVRMAAPTGWIKDRFVQSLETRLGRGLVFDFYSPWRYLRAQGGRLDRPPEIQARLLRLDDLSLLWADSCSLDPGHLPPPPLFLRLENVEKLYTPAALDRASGCADTLVARLFGDPER
jgi:hypothetical protein